MRRRQNAKEKKKQQQKKEDQGEKTSKGGENGVELKRLEDSLL